MASKSITVDSINNQKSSKSTQEKAVSSLETRQEVIEPPCVKVHIPKMFNVIKAPTVCPPGHRLDSFGKCRPIF
uniref:Uncharacterized protein n=1 Tax=Phlebotomus papatasi TaxID=29031 RepID=A0A1B0GMT9_PHLPP